MIRHVVMMKLKDSADGPEVQKRLEALPAAIAEIATYEVGLDELRGPRAWDVVLVSSFASVADLERYIEHPVHQEVVAFLNEVCETRASVDFSADAPGLEAKVGV